MTTITDIAKKLGISAGTVSKGLNGAKDISEPLRQTILETAVEMGYAKKKTSKKEQKKLCILIENMDYYMKDDFGYDIILGFKQAAFKESFDAEVIPTSHEFQRNHPYDAFLLNQNCSGAFICGFAFDDPWMEDLKATNVPTVILDNFIKENPTVGSVGSDSDEGIGLAIRHLTALGHKKIAFLNGSKGSAISEMRLEAYEKNMRLQGLEPDPELLAYGHFVSAGVEEHVQKFLAHGATAILCGNDLIAYGVMAECKRLGRSVPEDISVIGYDDLPSSAHSNPPLTSVKQDRSKLGKCSYYVLYALINEVALSRNLLRTTLTIRESTHRLIPAAPDNQAQR